MPIPVTITLNSIVGTPGPFNLYSNIDSYTTAFETGVSASGNVITSSNVPNGTTIVKIKSTGESCPYEITKSIVGLPTNTPTPTSTPTGTLTPTPTPLPGCSSIVTGEYAGSDLYNYDDRQLNFAGVANGSTISFTCTANNRPNNISIRTASTVLESTGWFGSTEGYNSGDYWYPTAGTGPITLTITYDNTLTYYIDTLTAPATLAPPNDESDYWEVNISCGGPTPTPTPIFTTLNNVVSGTTLSEVCAGGATTPTLYFAGVSIQIGESLYLNSNLTGPVPAGYYYYPDYNTVYNVTNGSTGAVASTPVCPTPTPTSTFLGWNFGTQLVENGPLAITFDDDPLTACSNPEYVIGDGTSNTVTWNFTVYGSNITDATAIVLLSSGFRSELGGTTIFYVKQRISGTFYYRRFQLNGSPGDTNVSATPTDVSFTC